MERQYYYTISVLRPDYIKSSIGMALPVVVLFFFSDLLGLFWISAIIFLLFFIIFIRTLIRHFTRITISEKCIKVRMFRERELSWRNLSGLQVYYYKAWRFGGDNWMRVVLRDSNIKLAIESSLEGFEHIVLKAKLSAKENKLKLSPVTISNLTFIGLEAAGELDAGAAT
tara:strand:- start:841 stop:1350 length:510 start_codon:yes stop_codon:yes gene_type:complete